MSKISAKSTYALAALCVLATSEKEFLQTKEIAQKGKIPAKYLEQILVGLKQAHIVSSLRGAAGGYSLAKDASQIIVYDVLLALESGFGENPCKSGIDFLESFWADIWQETRKIFSVSLADVLEYQKKVASSYTYII